MAANIYSNAFNFASYQDGSVDLRTGSYSRTIQLATLRPLGACEASRDIKLVYSMLTRSNDGYGIGWRLSNSRFDPGSRVLTLASGESYTAKSIPAVGKAFVFDDLKLLNMKAVFTDSKTITISYIDGTIEILRPPAASEPFRTASLMFENGEVFEFRYVLGALAAVKSLALNEDVVAITCKSDAISKVRVLTQGRRIAETSFLASNGQIVSVTVPYDNTNGQAHSGSQARFQYTYQDFDTGFLAITQVRNPMGGSDRILYDKNGLQYHNQSYLPVAVQLEQVAGAGQPALFKRYTYSLGRNFTGYPFSQGFQEGTDNLYRITGDYDYWGEETTVDATTAFRVVERVRHTFNRFHLLAREETHRGATRLTKTYTYNGSPKNPFSQQPANLQVPRRIDITFTDTASGRSRTETISVESDDYGNALNRIDSSGVRTDFEYYPIGGAGAACPPESSGYFVRYCKRERITPARGEGHVKIIDMTYGARKRISGIGHFAVETSLNSNSGITSRSDHIDDPTKPMLHGRITSQSVTRAGKTTATGLTYTTSGLDITERRITTGHDGSKASAERTFCSLTQRLLQAGKCGEPAVAFAYDIVGRVLKETAAAGTANSAAVSYAYHYADGTPDTAPARFIQTDCKGLRYVTRYDGQSRAVSVAQLENGAERLIRSKLYDCMGRPASETIYDRLEGKALSLTTRYDYGGWGELDRTTRPDGSIVLSVRDFAANTLTTGIQGLCTTVNYYNEFRKVAEVKRVTAGGRALTTLLRTYDGHGRCVTVQNAGALRTHYVYDDLDRILETRMEPTDGTSARTMATTYAAFSSDDLPVSVTMNGTVLGTRAYDGIGRLTAEANGKAGSTAYHYTGEGQRPSSRVTPRGATLNYKYSKNLGALAEITDSRGNVCRFDYDPMTGDLTRSGSSTANCESVYDDYQSVQSEKVVIADKTWQTTSKTSPGGRKLRMTDALGRTTVHHYDDAGRVSRIVDGDFTQTIAYDAFSRVASTIATQAKMTLETVRTYDEFGREASRVLRLNTVVIETMTRSYDSGGLLTERKTTDSAGMAVSLETFGYDAYSRLVAYSCEGTRFPVDGKGRTLKRQIFSFDALDNITRVESHFGDGTSNVSTRRFSTAIPTQLIEITDSHPAQTRQLAYDADGNLIRDHHGQRFDYDDFNHLHTSSAGGAYSYDATGRLVMQTPSGASPLHFLYADDRMIGQAQGDTSTSLHLDGDKLRGCAIRSKSGVRNEITGTDLSGSVVTRTDGSGKTVTLMYTPYGESAGRPGITADTLAAHPCTGFNGQHFDALAGLYHLGHGRRAYSPELMIFLSPDPLAPFGRGGFNAYGYCGGDPINMIDPSGLISTGANLGISIGGLLLAIAIFVVAIVAAVPTGGASLSLVAVGAAIGAGLGVLSGVLGVASAGISFVDEKNGWDRKSTADGLGIASLAIGLLSMAIGIGTAAATGTATTQIAKSMSKIGAAGRASGGGVIRLAADVSKVSLTTVDRLRPVAMGLGEFVKGMVGYDKVLWIAALGLANFGAGITTTVLGSMGLHDYINQKQGNTGANGDGQGETSLTQSQHGGSLAANEAVTDRFSDTIGSLRQYSRAYEDLIARVRISINRDLYGSGI